MAVKKKTTTLSKRKWKAIEFHGRFMLEQRMTWCAWTLDAIG